MLVKNTLSLWLIIAYMDFNINRRHTSRSLSTNPCMCVLPIFNASIIYCQRRFCIRESYKMKNNIAMKIKPAMGFEFYENDALKV